MTQDSSSDKRIKVTDKRMFTPDGELRQEYLDSLESSSDSSPDSSPDSGPGASPRDAAEPATPDAATTPAEADSLGAADPGTGPGTDEPEPELESGASFEDLVALLAQSASVYLQQAHQGIENRREYTELATLHVDLLALLKHRTRGNLPPAELAMLEQVLSQLRMALVQAG